MRTILNFSFTVLITICVTVVVAFGQYTSSDFTITTKGLSNEYASKFKDESNKKYLIEAFNSIRITHLIAPIKIIVSFENNEGNVIAEVNYDNNKIFSNNTDYDVHNQSWSRYGDGISVWLQYQIFGALSDYKRAVGTDDSHHIDKDLIKFDSEVKLKKSNGDWALFFARNYFDNRGFYPSAFYKNARINVSGKLYEIETPNPDFLEEHKFFSIGKRIGLDGKRTEAFYFSSFFQIADRIKPTSNAVVTTEFKKTFELPFKISQDLFNTLLSDKTKYEKIDDTDRINELLTTSLKNKLIALNHNPELTQDYSFFYIGTCSFKQFQLEMFVHQYHGLGDQLNAHLNIRDSNGEIIDTKEIGCYIESEMEYLLTTCIIDDKGIISMKISKEKSSRNEKYQINALGKITKMQNINYGK